jgi:hypothetical protein
MPLPAGTCSKNFTSASSPPAEAPMPTMGKERYALILPFTGDFGAVLATSRADGLFGGLAETGFFMD